MNMKINLDSSCIIKDGVCLTHNEFVCEEHLMHMYSDEYGYYCPYQESNKHAEKENAEKEKDGI